jgi:hypothetical protein
MLLQFALVIEQLLELFEKSDLRKHDPKGNAQDLLIEPNGFYRRYFCDDI